MPDEITKYVSEENLEQALTAVYDDMSKFKGMTKEFVDVLPDVGEDNVLYLVPNGLSLDKNTRTEYLWDAKKGVYECVGSTAIDSSDFVQKGDLQPLTTEEINAMITRAKGEEP